MNLCQRKKGLSFTVDNNRVICFKEKRSNNRNALMVIWQLLKTQGIQSADFIHAINRSVYSQYHVDLLKCIEQNVNNQSLTQVS